MSSTALHNRLERLGARRIGNYTWQIGLITIVVLNGLFTAYGPDGHRLAYKKPAKELNSFVDSIDVRKLAR